MQSLPIPTLPDQNIYERDDYELCAVAGAPDCILTKLRCLRLHPRSKAQPDDAWLVDDVSYIMALWCMYRFLQLIPAVDFQLALLPAK